LNALDFSAAPFLRNDSYGEIKKEDAGEETIHIIIGEINRSMSASLITGTTPGCISPANMFLFPLRGDEH